MLWKSLDFAQLAPSTQLGYLRGLMIPDPLIGLAISLGARRGERSFQESGLLKRVTS